VAERRIASAILLRLYRNRTPAAVAGRRLLFLCNGNVCRSVLAAEQARRLLGDHLALVDSAGLGHTAGRPPPELALKVAAAMGLDLASHRSLLVSVEQVRRADCVFVMDRLNVLRMWRRFPEARPKLFLLDAPREVPDPFGQPEQRFQEVFEQIGRSIERLAERCRRGG
jgi:protein-tyrosine-phosphatase